MMNYSKSLAWTLIVGTQTFECAISSGCVAQWPFTKNYFWSSYLVIKIQWLEEYQQLVFSKDHPLQIFEFNQGWYDLCLDATNRYWHYKKVCAF